jgi:protein SCO1/2
MKNKSYIGISLVLLVFGVIFIPKIVDRFKNSEVVEADRLNKVQKPKKDSGLKLIGNAPSFSLINQDNEQITSESLKGKVYVLEFFFSTCPTICPVMNRNLIDIEKKFSDHKDFGVVSITINPKYDTPEVLKNHKENHLNITSDNWHFLTSEDQDYIHQLAKKFNMYVGENINAPGGFEHSGLFALIDKNGKIRCRTDEYSNPILYYSGLNYLDKEGMEDDFNGEFRPQVDALIEDIEKLLNE